MLHIRIVLQYRVFGSYIGNSEEDFDCCKPINFEQLDEAERDATKKRHEVLELISVANDFVLEYRVDGVKEINLEKDPVCFEQIHDALEVLVNRDIQLAMIG